MRGRVVGMLLLAGSGGCVLGEDCPEVGTGKGCSGVSSSPVGYGDGDSGAPDPGGTEVPADTDSGATVDTDTDAPLVPQPCGTWVSAFTEGGAGFESNSEVAVAPDGARYVAGMFSGPVTFDPGGPAEATLTPAGTQDVYVARYEPSGALSWAVQLGGSSSTTLEQVRATADGVALAGSFHDTLAPAGVRALASRGDTDAWLGRIDAAGTVRWVRSAGGAGADFGIDLGVLSDGSLVAGGLYREDATFGDAGLVLPIGAAQEAGWLARYTADGDLQWAQAVAGTEYARVQAIGVTSADDLVVAGQASGPGVAALGAGQPGEIPIDPPGFASWLARWDADGTVLAAVTDTGIVEDLALAPDGGVLLTGYFQPDAVFAAGLANEVRLVATGQTDAYVARYEPDLALGWAAQSTSAPGAIVQALTVAPATDGGAVVLGYTTDAVRFGAGSPTEVLLDPAGGFNYDVFAVRYDPAGAVVCGVGIGGKELDVPDDVVQLPDGTWWLTLTYGGPVTLGAGGVYPATFKPVGAQDLLVTTWWL